MSLTLDLAQQARTAIGAYIAVLRAEGVAELQIAHAVRGVVESAERLMKIGPGRAHWTLGIIDDDGVRLLITPAFVALYRHGEA